MVGKPVATFVYGPIVLLYLIVSGAEPTNTTAGVWITAGAGTAFWIALLGAVGRIIAEM